MCWNLHPLLIEARERAFWMNKSAGADDVLDTVVPCPDARELNRQRRATEVNAGVIGCGHAGDGNVHLAVFCPDDDTRHGVAARSSPMELGRAIAGEHGLGRVKASHFAQVRDPAKIA